MTVNKSFAIVVILVSCVSFIGAIDNQSIDKSLSKTITLDQLKFKDLRDAFREIMSRAHIPGAIVLETHCDDDKILQLRPNDFSLRSLLDAIIEANPDYRWAVNDGVIEMFPIISKEHLLNIEVSEYSLAEKMPIYSALNQLIATKELRQFMTQANLGEIKTQLGPISINRRGGIPEEHLLQLAKYKKKTVRELLNIIARTNGYAVWEYREWGCKEKKEIWLNFMVR